MANIKGINIIDTAHTWYTTQDSFYTFNTQLRTPLYIHMKTNIPTASYSGWIVEAVGYNYGVAYPIRCAWHWTTQNNSDVANTSSSAMYSGLTASSVYTSSDGYCALRANAADLYYMGFVLNGYNHYYLNSSAATEQKQIAITGLVQVTTTGKYY